ncbi:relaxase/mobilization nuclease domain-containing protein [Olivibacter sp. 47]|uniref:relaxase/mobilization nuclease domain-containing protein n=1 Tax=Olivibacter sp. 47 TaxID=3056486 RepID=UPI0025A3A5CA|nr:relaxase/mobilization nuclease domain-containing protein [Olivibacter sp. 47]MDM8175937.1 relaxase/mobilization nuclease domain-containing protein [Olivibacter sp. 47]
MVAVIHASRSFRTVLNYNENKVREGMADCISAGSYPKNVVDMAFNEKLNRLRDQAALRPSVKVNCVHVSLNFDPSESLSAVQMDAIAEDYLDRLGFTGQPYLLYRHYDAAHPHVHLVTTNIRNDGSAIKLHNIGKSRSEEARKAIEKKYHLVRATDSEATENTVKSAYSQRIEYGKSETRRAIAGVLAGVLTTYCYGSVAELNALLGLYNVEASRGKEESRIYKNRGVIYRILDNQGRAIGVPIKASLLPGKPTLNFLEERFVMNRIIRRRHRSRLRNAIDMAFLKGQVSTVNDLVGLLKTQGIDTIIRRNSNGDLYGITYVDHTTKCVFNGSELGKSYGSNAIKKRSGETDFPVLPLAQPGREEWGKRQEKDIVTSSVPVEQSIETNITGDFMETLIGPEYANEQLPWELRNRLKRKRKKKRSQDER